MFALLALMLGYNPSFANQLTDNQFVRVGSLNYPSLFAAYSSSSNGSVIQALAIRFEESLVLDRAINIVLKGGYDSAFNSNIGRRTVLKGPLFIVSGKLIADKITIGPSDDITNNQFLLPTPTVGTNVIGDTQAVIPSSGGSLELANVAKVEIPAGGGTSDQFISITSTSDPNTAEAFDLISFVHELSARQPYEVRINFGKTSQPLTPVHVAISLPDSSVGELPSGATVLGYKQIDIEYDITGFDLIDTAIYDSYTKTVQFDLAPDDFSSNNSSDGTLEAVVIIGYADTGQTARALTALSAITVHTTVGFASPLAKILERADYNPIYGYFGAPRDMSTKPRPHRGFDIRTTNGDAILAGHDGEAIPLTQCKKVNGTNKCELDATGNVTMRGWGKYVVLKSKDDKSATLYAHLSKNATRRNVVQGDIIGEAGVTGNPTPANPHLHFEFIPSYHGNGYEVSGRVDPLPYIQITNLFGLTSDSDFAQYFTLKQIDLNTGSSANIFSNDLTNYYLQPGFRVVKVVGSRVYFSGTMISGMNINNVLFYVDTMTGQSNMAAPVTIENLNYLAL